MAGLLRRRGVVLAALAVTVAAGAWWWWASRPDPDRTAETFAAAFQRQDWGAVYEMATNKEKSLQPWEKEQFVSVMRDVFLRQVGKVVSVSTSGDWQRQTTTKYFVFTFQNPEGMERVIGIHFYRDFDDWHPSVAWLPILLCSGKNGDRGSARALYDACITAGVREFVRLFDRTSFSIDKLGKYADGQVEWSDLYSPYTGY
jgi:hypothetical protein